MEKILVINAGSSTIKWTLFLKKNLEKQASGVADRIFVDGVISTKVNDKDFTRKVNLTNHAIASQEIVNDLMQHKIINDVKEIKIIGNRVVQGGTVFKKTVIIQEEDVQKLEQLSVLAPLHNPGAVQAIKAFKSIFKNAILTATFDTAFHSDIPKINYTYPINEDFAQKYQIRKYGMHGISHMFVTKKLEEILDKKPVSFVSLHIGNGVSLSAILDSVSINNSMGLTPLAGVMMGTRSGDIDPSIHAYACREAKISIEEFEKILNKDSGLKGISHISQDLRDIEHKAIQGDKQAQFAIELYSKTIANYLIKYLNEIGKKKLDAIVFTAGVGENSPIIRKKVIEKIKLIKILIDDEENEKKFTNHKLISSKDSDVKVFVIRTNEELMIAKEGLEVCKIN